jgi:hypothetical protein
MHLPYVVASFFIISVFVLIAALQYEWIRVAEASVVVSLSLAFLLFLCAAGSAVLCAVNWFDGYWSSGYPTTHGMMFVAYALFSLPAELYSLPVALVAFAVGWLISRKCTDWLKRFVPLMALGLFLVFGEVARISDFTPVVLMICAGLILSISLRSRWSGHTA